MMLAQRIAAKVQGGPLALLLAAALAGCQASPLQRPSPAGAVPQFVLTAVAPATAATPVGQAGGSPAAGQAPDGSSQPGSSPAAAPTPRGSSPASGGGSSSGGAGGSAPAGAGPAAAPIPAGMAMGTVVEDDPAGLAKPVAGASVRAYGATAMAETTTGDAGEFSLATPFGLASMVVSAPGYPISQVDGVQPDLPLALHLEAPPLSPLSGTVSIPVRGTVVTDDGTPAADAVVVAGNARGQVFGPVSTDAQGRFRATAQGLGGVPKDVAVFAFRMGADHMPVRLGLTSHVAVDDGAAIAVTLAAAAEGGGTLDLAGPQGTRTGAVRARADNGFELTLRAWSAGEPLGDFPFFSLPEATIWAEAQVLSADASARSGWRARVDAAAPVHGDLLGFPAAPAGRPVAGQPLSWAATPGAKAYRLSVTELHSQLPIWEAATGTAALTPRDLPPGAGDALVIQALAGGIEPRSLASFPAVRRLVIAPDDGREAATWSSRTVNLGS